MDAKDLDSRDQFIVENLPLVDAFINSQCSEESVRLRGGYEELRAILYLHFVRVADYYLRMPRTGHAFSTLVFHALRRKMRSLRRYHYPATLPARRPRNAYRVRCFDAMTQFCHLHGQQSLKELSYTESYEEPGDNRVLVNNLLRYLPLRERNVLVWYYGLGEDGHSFTVNEIAAAYRCSRTLISRIRQRGIERMKNKARELGIDC
jgi:RNA polymerase sigma factor (sigma-70 family)